MFAEEAGWRFWFSYLNEDNVLEMHCYDTGMQNICPKSPQTSRRFALTKNVVTMIKLFAPESWVKGYQKMFIVLK